MPRVEIHGDDHVPDPLGSGPDAIRDLRMFYVLPFAPALEPDDYVAGDDLYSAWVGDWQNVSEDHPPTGYSLAIGGGLRFQIYATGDEATENSLMFTLPEEFWPKKIRRLFVVCGAAAEAIGAVDVYPDGLLAFPGGSVVFVNQITSF